MNNNNLVQSHHLQRKAMIYVRQSTLQQVLSHEESRRLQLAMRGNAQALGWSAASIEVIETDTGTSARSVVARDGYKDLLSEVALGRVGIVLSYESTRLSRNCSDWYPLLDVCALRQCLIADRDGVYDPATINGRLLLGMKGIVSEIELHTLRGRLQAGVLNKAKRGELALALPIGLLRLETGDVDKDPDQQVQHAIELVFQTFLQLRSAYKVLRHHREHGLLLPARQYNPDTVWRTPTAAAINRILRNPAYAGAYVYGRTEFLPGKRPGAGPYKRRRKQEDWTVLIPDHYPRYIAWPTWERIQRMLDDNYAEYCRNRTRGVPREGSALLQGLVYCGLCGHKMTIEYKSMARYICNYLAQQTSAPACQRLVADPIDAAVVDAFFEALAPAELDLHDAIAQRQTSARAALEKAQRLQLQRLRYEADLARRRYERVDPDRRLVTAELERRWEEALSRLQEAEGQQAEAQREHDKVIRLQIPPDQRKQFRTLGDSLPRLWAENGRLNRSHRKAILRSLIDKVVLRHPRERWGQVEVRIVWKGGAVSPLSVFARVGDIHDLPNYPQLERELLALVHEGHSDGDIAQRLTQRGYRSAAKPHLNAGVVSRIRRSLGQTHERRVRRPPRIPGHLSMGELAAALAIPTHWFYHQLKRGSLRIPRDEKTGWYAVPDESETLEQIRQLHEGDVDCVDISR